MDLELSGKKENKALQRSEVSFKLKAKVTPSRKQLLPKIAALLNAKEQLVVISKIGHPFGSREATITARVYENEASLKKFEAQHLIDRDLGKKRKKKEEKPKQPEKEARTKEAGKEKEGEAAGERKEGKPAKEKEAEEKPSEKAGKKKEEKPSEKAGKKKEEKPSEKAGKKEEGGE